MIEKQTIDSLNCSYGDALDNQDYDSWIDFFVPDCLYIVQSRENFDRKLPLALIRLESQNMMKDRVYGCMDTIFHQPYYQRHVIGGCRVVSFDDRVIISRSNYAVFRTKFTQGTELFNVGCYHDRWIMTDQGFKIQERICVYDSEMIPNAVIYPI